MVFVHATTHWVQRPTVTDLPQPPVDAAATKRRRRRFGTHRHRRRTATSPSPASLP
jgi:hypothetical protein